MKLSVIVPVYNERHTVEQSIQAVLDVGRADEILIVDDGSTDGTRDLYPQIEAMDETIRVVMHDRNMGKGAAVRTGFQQATGDILLIQDADLEYDLREYPVLLADRGGPGCRGLWFALPWRADKDHVFLAYGRQQNADAGYKCTLQHHPVRHGNLLQGLSGRCG
ncbi:MAG: glycosyltransferase family 2 protein [Chloroflexota bacterium]